MALLGFLATAVAVSLSGVMAPGPMTAAALAAGPRSRHAGAVLAVGHAVIEVPLMLLLAAGAGAFLKSQAMGAAIGLVGGVFLLWMGSQLLIGLPTLGNGSQTPVQRHPFWTGIVLTGANPYFLLWWATVGLTLTNQAVEFGLLALALFVVLHWLCDLGWLEALSLAGFKGSQWAGPRAQKAVFFVCALVLLGFGLKFLYDAGGTLYGMAFHSGPHGPLQ